AITILL
ncbi:hypothetical protein D046_6825, partial [Vibrio parahaemolyticus V-223/04]